MALDIEKEKKKNLKLAIGVAAIGIFFSVGLYVIMFALMFLRPGLVFSFMPFPTLSKNIAGINNRLYVISKEIDFSGLSFENKKEPKEKFMLSLLDDKNPDSREIKPFHSFTNDSKKIYFLSEGFFRTFDSVQWAETRTDAAGKRPEGVISPDGLFVLSVIKNNPTLNLIKDSGISSIPLPEEYLADKNKKCSTQMLWFQGRLYLFWPSDNDFYWTSYDGKAWSSTESFAQHGPIKAIADDKRMYLFYGQHSEQMPSIYFTAYEDGSWSEPKDLNVQGLFIDWSPIIHQGKLHLFVRSFSSENLYTIENGNAVSPVRISSSFFGKGFFRKIVVLLILSSLVFLFFIYLLSVFIRKFKLKAWQVNSTEYEFASLFRRFIAKVIDTIIIIIPPAIVIVWFLFSQDFWTNPFKLCAIGIFAFIYLILGNFLYHSLLEGIYGKTPGKKICGIVVLKDDFSKCGLLAGFLRNVMRIADNFFYYLVGIISMAGTLKWQRLGDIVAETVVVREKKS